jgi:hypothetical protein
MWAAGDVPLSRGALAAPSDPWNFDAPQYVRLVEKVQTADQQDWRGRVQAEEGQQRYTSRTTPHVTYVTRHAQNAKPTSRCRTVAPWSIPLHHEAPRCDGCYYPETDGES